MFTIDYVNNTIWTPTLRDDFSCYPLRMCPTEGSTRYDRASRSVIRLRFHTSLDQKRFLLHARKEKTELSPRQNGREVQVGLVTQLVVELNLLETGRNTLSRSLKREKVLVIINIVNNNIRFVPYARAATTFRSSEL